MLYFCKMFKHIFLIFLLVFNLSSKSQNFEKRTYTVKNILNKPIIDAKEDRIWYEIEPTSKFVQYKPNNGKEERPGFESEIKIAYDKTNLYVLAKLRDPRIDSLNKELAKRDDDNKNFDKFSVLIDPYSNGQLVYNFTVSASNVQSDSKIIRGNKDMLWDAVWNSEVKIYSKYWLVEIEIPLSNLRYSVENSSWNFNFERTIRRYRETYTWNYIDVSYEDVSLQKGIVNGFDNLESSLRLSLMPYFSSYIENFQSQYSYPYNIGMDLKYGINESYTLDATLIPDFGQVASDDQVLNLSPFEIKFEERRQFFNEGTELFNKGGNMFYSRRVQDDLINATKISGRNKNGLAIGVLNALNANSSFDTLKNYNISIVDQSFNKNSSVSIMNTNMYQNNGLKKSNVTGVFTNIVNKNNTFSYSANIKLSNEVEESVNTGFSAFSFLRKTSGNFRYELMTLIEDEKFNTNDLGFLESNNEIYNSIELSYYQFNPSKNFINSNTEIEISHKTLFKPYKFTEFEFEAESNMMLKNYLFTKIRFKARPFESNDYYETRDDNFNNPMKRSRNIYFGTYLSSDYRKKFAIDFGTGIEFEPLYDTRTFRWRASPLARLSDKLSLRYVLSVSNTKNDYGYIDSDSLNGESIYSIRDKFMITNVLSGSYIFNNKINLSYKLRHYWSGIKNKSFHFLNNNGYFESISYQENKDINYLTWTSNISLDWIFAPGSEISLVWKNELGDNENIFERNIIKNLSNTFDFDPFNSISVKLVYYLDYKTIINND